MRSKNDEAYLFDVSSFPFITSLAILSYYDAHSRKQCAYSYMCAGKLVSQHVPIVYPGCTGRTTEFCQIPSKNISLDISSSSGFYVSCRNLITSDTTIPSSNMVEIHHHLKGIQRDMIVNMDEKGQYQNYSHVTHPLFICFSKTLLPIIPTGCGSFRYYKNLEILGQVGDRKSVV